MRALLILALLALPLPVGAEETLERFMADLPACIASAGGRAATEACIGTGAGACFDGSEGGQSTLGMSFCLLAERDVWDRLLNEEYARAREAATAADEAERPYFPEYAVRVTQLRDAQRTWIAFRDANCAMQYGIYGAGTMRQIAGADCPMQMTAQRMLDLREYREMLGD